MNFRIGQGVDRHRFETGRPLILGGVEVPHDRGLAGHSDGDALLHAICDALLGAAALGDLGQHFSDRDPANRDKDSAGFVRSVLRKLQEAGYTVGNVDSTILAEEPMLASHVPAMRRRIAELLEVDESSVSVKATRGEGLGPEGRAECITVHAIALIEAGS